MGTNYYVHFECCSHCGRPASKEHIGKSSMGWSFSFHGTDEIRSWKDWQKVLENPANRIFDEYEREMPFDEFKALIEKKKIERFNHARDTDDPDSPYYQYMRETYGRDCFVSHYQENWLDDEGNSFSAGEFS